jgi:hypothetical protein
VPYKHTYEVFQWGKRRRPKFATETGQYKLHPLFEMTHDKKKYKGYTAVEGFKRENLADLAETIDTYR